MYESTPYDNTSPIYDPIESMLDHGDDEGFLMARMARRHRIEHSRLRGLDDEILRMARSYQVFQRFYDPIHGSDRQYQRDRYSN